LDYVPAFLSSEEEGALVEHIRRLALEPFQFGEYEGKRRTSSFGFRYDFTHQRLEAAAPLPDWLMPMLLKVEQERGLAAGSIAHALVTEYAAGAGIGWHRDKKAFDEVFGISLLWGCPFRFRRRHGMKWQRYTLDLAPGSLYALTGGARHVWEHSIATVASTRYSITFRTMAAQAGGEVGST
jgi:alkylated DNA repair dioxygenase AlkB